MGGAWDVAKMKVPRRQRESCVSFRAEAQRRSRRIARFPTEGHSTGTTAIPHRPAYGGHPRGLTAAPLGITTPPANRKDGVVPYGVQQRVCEIGVRVALGATSGDVLRLIVGRSIGFVATGALNRSSRCTGPNAIHAWLAIRYDGDRSVDARARCGRVARRDHRGVVPAGAARSPHGPSAGAI